MQRLNRSNPPHDGDNLDDDGGHIDDGEQVVGRLEGEGGALAARAGGGPGTNGVRSVSSTCKHPGCFLLMKDELTGSSVINCVCLLSVRQQTNKQQTHKKQTTKN